MAFLCVYFPSVPYFSVGLKKSLNYTLEILIYDVKDYIRHFSNAFFIVISGIVFKIWRVRFFFPCLRLMAFLNRADYIFLLLWEQGSSLYLDTTTMKPYFVLDAGEILVCYVCYLIFLPDRGPAVVKEHSYIGHESPGVFHIARLHHPLTRAMTQHSSHWAASLRRNKRGFLFGTP